MKTKRERILVFRRFLKESELSGITWLRGALEADLGLLAQTEISGRNSMNNQTTSKGDVRMNNEEFLRRREFIRRVEAGESLPNDNKVRLRDEEDGKELYMLDFPEWQIHLHYDQTGELIKGHLKGKGDQSHVRDQVYQVDADLILEKMRKLAEDGTIVMEHVG